MSKDLFANNASDYDQDRRRVNNVDSIAHKVCQNVELRPDMHLADFGAGTGMLLERIAPYVKKITAIDISESMIAELQKKSDQLPCELEIQKINLETETVDTRFDGIISSMTMHHVRNIENMFSKFYFMLHDRGFIAIADLDKEDGRFHAEDTGVFHFGFERETLTGIARDAGFKKVQMHNASVIKKLQGDYSVFLLTAEC